MDNHQVRAVRPEGDDLQRHPCRILAQEDQPWRFHPGISRGWILLEDGKAVFEDMEGALLGDPVLGCGACPSEPLEFC